MRKLLIILAVVFTASLMLAAGVPAAKTTTGATTHKYAKTKKKAAAVRCPTTKKMARPARVARGPRVHKATKVTHKRMARPARIARGPRFACPAPVVNVPQQAAPVINVPQQAAPVVNIPQAPPTVGVSSDATNIYVLRGNQLTVLDKCSLQPKQTVTLP